MIWRGIRRAARVLAMAGLLAAATTASAQDDGDETARRGELAREIVALIDIERGLEAMLDEATSSLVDGATHLPPAERQRRATVFQEVMREVIPAYVRRFLDATADLYAETFTLEELEAMLAFNRTPVGRSVTEKSFALGVQMALLEESLMPGLLRDLLIAICAREPCDGVESESARPI